MMITLELLTLEAAYGLMDWEASGDERLRQYNFSEMDVEDITYWYYLKQRRWRRKIFGVFLDKEELIGFVTIKRINPILKSAFLGVAFNPKYLNRGFGTIAISQLLTHVFNDMTLKVVKLDVASFNARAIRSYEKCGFIKVSERIERYESQDHAVKIAQMDLSFFIKGRVLYTRIIRMALLKVNWLHNLSSQEYKNRV